MKIIIIFTIAILTSISSLHSQAIDIQNFGNQLGKAIVKNDSILYKSLIVPKEAIIEKLKKDSESTLNESEFNELIENVHNNYQELIDIEYMMSFFNLTTKTDIFNLNLNDLDYEIVEVKGIPEDFHIIPVYATIDHDTYKHFTFFLTKYEDKLYLASHLIHISDVNKFEEREELKKVNISADENGFIICKGRIELDSNIISKNEILNCLLNSPTTIGVLDYSSTEDDNSKMCFVIGKWQYPYYIDSGETSAGTVEFKYQFNISDGYIDYNYYDFIHSKDDSNFESIGLLPYKFNEKVSKVFTKSQFEEIAGEIFLNQLLAIKRTKKYTDKCFN